MVFARAVFGLSPGYLPSAWGVLEGTVRKRYAVCGKEMPAACLAPGAPPPRPTALQPFDTDMTRRSGLWRTFMCGSGADAMPRTAPFVCGAAVRDRGVAPASKLSATCPGNSD